MRIKIFTCNMSIIKFSWLPRYLNSKCSIRPGAMDKTEHFYKRGSPFLFIAIILDLSEAVAYFQLTNILVVYQERYKIHVVETLKNFISY